ncbi:MAG: DMT family transporter [Chloroflexi bacterium]|nr:DMT family transporter [Chloroflexota bacterium]
MMPSGLGSIGRDRTTLLAFGGVVLFGGLNALAVKASNAELAPYWGAALRFGAGAVLLAILTRARSTALPRGRALLGSVIFGIFNFTLFYALLYQALLSVPAGLTMVILALAPLLTLVLAVVVGQERLRATAIAGAVIAVVGIALVFREGIGAGVPVGPALLVLGGAAAIAVASVVVKGFPAVDPFANNLVAMSVGALGLVGLSGVAGEAWVVPGRADTWLALAYLVVLGSVALFVLVVYVIGRWSASASSYAVVLMPLITVPTAALLAGEAVTPAFLLGSAIVLAGVYLGTSATLTQRKAPPDAAPTGAPPTLATPGCP